MGQLHEAIDIEFVVKHNEIKALIETGTGLGSTVARVASTFPELRIYTIESVGSVFLQATANLAQYLNVECKLGTSSDVLPEVLTTVSSHESVLFWLDAHFPGADFGLAAYGDTQEDSVRLPLESELRLILDYRDVSNDFFVIDDLRIYEDGPFESGNWTDRHLYGADGIDFIYELLDSTHKIIKNYSQQGYVIAEPR